MSIRTYRVTLAVSLAFNLLFAVALYYYSSVEGFMSLITMAVGMFG